LSAVLGHERAVIWPLHEQALARGAKPHWLGYLGVADPELEARRFVERGAMPLGPARATNDRGQIAVLRDPGGAILAVSSLPSADSEPELDVAYHTLNSNDLASAQRNYGELFGWSLTDRIDLGAQGTFQQFAWQAGGDSVGALADIAGRPGVHPHWLFFFAVDSLDSAMKTSRASGGVVLAPISLPNGQRVCVCDDPQGAAFGLWQRR
jgi:predicted enzyme related to lactoylglutathione lyase